VTAPLDRIDARVRCAAALVLVVVTTVVTSPAALAAAAAVALGLAASARLRPKRLAARLAHVEGVVLVLLVVVPFSVPGAPVARVLGFTMTAEGLARAAALAVKVNVCLLVTLALVGTLEPTRLARALAGLRVPDRLVHLLLFLIRYLDLARLDVARLVEAMRVRGFRPRPSGRTRRALAQAAGAALVRAIERAERIEEAMRCRGFTGRLPRPRSAPLTAVDGAAAGGVVLVTAVLMALELAA
jgi:cobalt/nickel transport system permease protein